MTTDYNRLHAIRNYLAYDDTLATAGQPDADQLQWISEAGYERIINLATENSPCALHNEAELVTRLGLEYVHIPVDFKAPALDDLQKFFQAMQAQPPARTFVHCAFNWRVSCFIYLYRILRCGIGEKEAEQDLRKIWHPDQTWLEFMRKARSLPFE